MDSSYLYVVVPLTRPIPSSNRQPQGPGAILRTGSQHAGDSMRLLEAVELDRKLLMNSGLEKKRACWRAYVRFEALFRVCSYSSQIGESPAIGGSRFCESKGWCRYMGETFGSRYVVEEGHFQR